MDAEKARRLEEIRDRKLSMREFRHHSDILADDLVECLRGKMSDSRWPDVMPILVFRASLVFLPSLVRRLVSPIGFLGLKRDERTLKADKYYVNLPKFNDRSVIAIFDPMLGTAGTLGQTLEEVKEKYKTDTGRDMDLANVYFVGFLACRSGYEKALGYGIPADNIILLAVDPILDANGYIAPGLGDFGDRYFGS